VHAEFPLQRDQLIACRTGGNHTPTLREGPLPRRVRAQRL